MHGQNANPPVRPARRSAMLLAGLLCLGVPVTVWAQAERKVTMEAPDGAAIKAATDQKVQSLTQELARIANDHGADSVALQASLLIEAMRAGAVGPSEVRVAGPSPREGGDYLNIDVGTGLIFDADTTDLAACNRQVWSSVAAPVLAKMERFDIRPAGLELVFSYGLQRFSDHEDRKADPSEPQESHTVRYVLPASVLDDLASRRITIEAALAAGRSAVDDVSPPARIETPDAAP